MRQKRNLIIPPHFTLPQSMPEQEGVQEDTDISTYATFRVRAVTLTPLPVSRKMLLLCYALGIVVCIVIGTWIVFQVHPFIHLPFMSMTLVLALGILCSTLASMGIRQWKKKEQKRDTFTFQQRTAPQAWWHKGIEYTVYILGYLYSGYLLLMTVLSPQGITYTMTFYIFLGLVYTILLRPNFLKRILWMLIAPWVGLRSRKQASQEVAYRPLVSLIVAAYNEEVGIISTLQSIMSSTYAPLELIVVTDGCTDTTDERVRAYICQHGHHFPGKSIRHYPMPHAGKSAALNTGIHQAHGELILTTDADCFVHPQCVENMVNYFRNPAMMGATGNYRVGNVHSLLGRIQAMEYAVSRYTLRTDAVFNTIFVMSGTISCFRKSVFERIGLFHVGNTTEDLEITMRMHKAGMRIGYCPDAIVYTETPITWQGLFRQRLRWVRGSIDAFAQHADILFSTQRTQSKLHSWVTLPIIRFNQFAVLAQLIGRIGIIIFSMVSHTYIILATTCVLNAIIISISVLAVTDYPSTALLAPLAWLLFEVPGSIYTLAFIVAWWDYLHKRQRPWQHWQRQGIGQEETRRRV